MEVAYVFMRKREYFAAQIVIEDYYPFWKEE